jgi:amino acid adenylation domain-containing protein
MKTENIQDIYELSPAQQGILFHSLYSPDSGVYITQRCFLLHGHLHVVAFECAWQQVVARHAALRTSFYWENLDKPLQVVHQEVKFPFKQYDWRELTSAEQQKRLEAFLESDRHKGFELSQTPLIRLSLIQLADDSYQIVLSQHHLILDGWSSSLVLKKVVELYEALSQGQNKPLAPSRSYGEYIGWLQQQNLSKAEEFWRRVLSGIKAPTPLIKLNIDKFSSQEDRYDDQILKLSTETTAALQSLAQQHHLTLNTLVQGAWAVLLSRYSGEEEIVYGNTVSGRPVDLVGVESMVGMFINTLPVRVKVDAEQSLVSWLKQLQAQLVEMRQYEYSPLTEVQGWSEIPRGLPLFESIVVFESYPVDRVLQEQTASLEVQNFRGIERTNYPLAVIVGLALELQLRISYNCSRFDVTTINRMLGHFQTLLQGMVSDFEMPLKDLPLLTEVEKHQLLREWNDTEADYPQDACIHQLFEAQVEKTPDAVAVVFENQQLTYQQLNQRANQLAHHLQSLGVRPEVLVGICVERSLEMVVGLLGILKAGGAYVPLDPNYPQERLSYMLADSGVEVLLTQRSLLESLPEHQAQMVCLNTDWGAIERHSQENLDVGVSSDNLAYVIYTSGSTGQPKGVMNTHQGIHNRLLWMQQTYQLTSSDRVVQKTPFSFDVSVWEFFWPLLTGARIVVALPEGHKDSTYLVNLISQQQITTIHFVPTMLQVFLQEPNLENCSCLKRVFCSGEALPFELTQRFFSKLECELHNLYGPTEAAIDVTFWQCHPQDNLQIVPIGRPIANTQIYILDKHLQPVPIGVAGELYIGGDGLARGYLNRPELTQEKFIPNPFDKSNFNTQKSKLYKTGDLARYLPDGNIEFLGRIDHQVKIRGFRIELGEIEAVLNTHSQIQQAVVIATEDIASNKRLVAYLVTRDESLTTNQLHEFLKQKLPEYMVPSTFVTLDTLPLTPNGKVDRKALPVPDGEISREHEYVAPRTASEEIIANIFASVLGVQNVGIHDNFFELGGHSLLATQLISRLRVDWDVEIPLRAVFESPTIAQLEPTLTQLRTTHSGLSLPPIQPRTHSEQLPLSFAQQRLWFLNQLEGSSATYNIPGAVRITGNLDVNTLQQALSEIVRRHEVLRTSFQTVNGTPIQVIHPEATLKITVVDLKPLEVAERETVLHQQAQQEAITPFNLEIAPLIRCSLLQLSATEYVFLLTMHHIVSDGWSIGVFIQELSSLYQAFGAGEPSPLIELPIQYADFAVWQRQWLSGEVLETQLNYWLSQLQGAPDLLKIPTDRPRPSVQTYRGATQSFTLSTDLTQKLQTLSRESGTTLFTTLLAAFATLLYRYSGQEDILIGSPIANRHRREIESLIGFFVNTLVLRTRFDDHPSIKDLLARVRETTLQAYEHQDVPFEQLVEVLRPHRSLSYSPLFQVMFILQNAPMGEVELPGVTLTQLERESTIAKFDLTLSLTETNWGLVGGWEYNTDLFDRSTIERMTAHFQNLLSAIVENPQQTVAELPLLSEAERHQLLMEWNDTQSEYPSDQCIHQLFEEQVERTPDSVAVVFEDQQLTYRELNARANQLANYLQKLGVKPEVLVGICVERSLEMVVGLLGILKAGGAYLPVDPAYPQERQRFLLSDSQVSVLLTQETLVARLPDLKSSVVCLDADWMLIAQESRKNPVSHTRPENLAYVIYTSGSTGKPKGAMIQHQSLVNYTQAAMVEYAISPSDRILQFASISFDAAAEEIFPCLARGAMLVLRTNEMLSSIPAFLRRCDDWQLTVLDLPTAFWHQIVAELPALNLTLPDSVRLVIIGGEKALPERLTTWQQQVAQRVRLVNTYGPTEATIVTTAIDLSGLTDVEISGQELPIGKAISHAKTYILAPYLQPVPVGVPGEIYIGGVGVARGYSNRPELTALAFIPDPFSGTPGARLYRTGDRVRYRTDGTIEFLGRLDRQVKIRGFRIELGEIEAVLSQYPGVREAVVAAWEDEQGSKRLVAYTVFEPEQAPIISELRRFLEEKLLSYMIPSAFVPLDALPLTPNGKVDRKALPAPEVLRRELDVTYVMPQTEAEQAIAKVWQNTLKIEKIGIHDNFFELGGHSLLLVQINSQLRELFNTDLSLIEMFRYPTVSALADYFSQARNQQSFLLDLEEDIQAEKVKAAKVQQQKRRQKMQSQ